MTLLAIDPGRSFTGTGKARQSIGWSVFRDDGTEFTRGYLSFEDLCRSLLVRGLDDEDDFGQAELWFSPVRFGGYRVHEIVIEDFVNDPQSARGGQRNGTSECIGAVEILAVQAGVPFTRQRSDVLTAAKLHAPKGSFKDLKHLHHEDSAFLHGHEYLVRKGVIEVDLSATM